MNTMKHSIFLLIFSVLEYTQSQNFQQPPPIKGNEDDPLRIIGGSPTTDGELPYQILLLNQGRHSCGGSFISVKGIHFVLTAAHCVTDTSNPSRYTIIAGENDRTTTSGNEQRRRVTRVLAHRQYSSTTYQNDIALLVLDRPFEVNKFVSPIPLPQQGQATTGNVVVSGWGSTTPFGMTGSRFLQKVTVSVIDNLVCKKLYVFQRVTSSMLCAGRLKGFSDSCNGDSGGPLRAVNGGYQAGIVSWGTICAFPFQPGVNTRVSHYVSWIEQQASSI
ncbi:Trypsin-1 [Orchesella cincta]|uniref:Trypsin-1 n=1 Tax=Orchesella cincta TaxID=48709 RepID=A0A1D2N311_ORCCI|nr:Trypsin-1 [Orchesella cincta]